MENRYNLQLSEDLRQIRTGRTLHTLVAMDDCETLASHMMASANALNDLMVHLSRDCSNVDDFVCPKLFAGLSLDERQAFLHGCTNILAQVHPEEGVYMFCNTGNAYGAAAGGSTARSLNGHCYAGTRVRIGDSIFQSIMEVSPPLLLP